MEFSSMPNSVEYILCKNVSDASLHFAKGHLTESLTHSQKMLVSKFESVRFQGH